MQISVIIAAAGSACRMGCPGNKALLSLMGQPVLSWSLQLFEQTPEVTEIIIAARPEDMDEIKAIASHYPKVRAITAGGNSRAASVQHALAEVAANCSHIAVHDAARPLLSPADWRALLTEAAQGPEGAILACPARDSIRSHDGYFLDSVLDRDTLLLAQTPQLFPAPVLQRAYHGDPEQISAATDEAELVRASGEKVRFVLSRDANFKLTVPEDLHQAEAVLRQRVLADHFPQAPLPDAGEGSSLRYGLGWDTHRLEAGRRLILGGVEIEHHLGLAGHSDADVLLHAIIDSLLGATALGDIGRHFPDTDPRYKDISSLILLQKTGSLLQQKGWQIVHIDANIIAERPRLAPHIEAICTNIAHTLALPLESISVKAKTAEKLGDIGNERAIAAMAIATVCRH